MDTVVSATGVSLGYDLRAESYARHRKVHPGVLEKLLESGFFTSESHILDVGCGTGNYPAELAAVANCRVSGIDPSARMLDRARDAASWESLVQGNAEQLPFDDDSFDVVMSTDVIHHVGNRDAYFQEAARVLRPGGQIVTVTDSHDDIGRRRPLSSHFPETIEVELQRYPPVPLLLSELKCAGFTEPRIAQTELTYDLLDIQLFRERAFSSLHVIDEEAFRQGIARLEADLRHGPIPCISLYTIIWGTLKGAVSNAA